MQNSANHQSFITECCYAEYRFYGDAERRYAERLFLERSFQANPIFVSLALLDAPLPGWEVWPYPQI
jgi:hypothetical protein